MHYFVQHQIIVSQHHSSIASKSVAILDNTTRHVDAIVKLHKQEKQRCYLKIKSQT